MSDRRPLPGWPLGLVLELAAAYVGLSETTFQAEVKAGRAPAAVWLTDGRKVWHRHQLDRWLDDKAGQTPTLPLPAPEPVNDWDAFLSGARATPVS